MRFCPLVLSGHRCKILQITNIILIVDALFTTSCSCNMISFCCYIARLYNKTSLNNLYIFPEIQFPLCIYGNGFHFPDVINVSQTFSRFRQLLHIQTIKRRGVTHTLRYRKTKLPAMKLIIHISEKSQ